MGVAAMGAPAIVEMFAFGNNSQRRLQSEFGGVDDDIFGLFAFDFFISMIQA